MKRTTMNARVRNRAMLLLFVFSSLLVFAQAPSDVQAKLDALDASVKAAQSSADNGWMLTSSALVLMMTGPGLALFYG